VAKSGKGQSAGTAGTRSAPKDAAKEIGRLEKRLQKARDVATKRKKQASEARAEVVQLTAQIKELRPPTVARSRARAKPAAAKPAAAKPAATKPAAAKPAVAKAAARKPKGAVSSTGTTATARRSATSTTGRKAATPAATRTPRTRRAVQADGSGDGTGPT
jgi:hypothetical protein